MVEEEEERGVSGQPGSSRATRRKPRYHPPSTPRFLSSKRPCHTSPSAPAAPVASSSSALSSHAALLRVLSKPPPRFYLRFLLAARAAKGGGWVAGWVGGQPPPARRSALTHAPQPRVRRHLRWYAASKDGFTTTLRRINSAVRWDVVSLSCSMRFPSPSIEDTSNISTREYSDTLYVEELDLQYFYSQRIQLIL